MRGGGRWERGEDRINYGNGLPVRGEGGGGGEDSGFQGGGLKGWGGWGGRFMGDAGDPEHIVGEGVERWLAPASSGR